MKKDGSVTAGTLPQDVYERWFPRKDLTMATKTKKKRSKHLPGMEPPSFPKIEKAADEYRKVRDMRMEYTQAEVEKQAILLKAMEDEKLTIYEYDGFKVEVKANPKVKVRKIGEESNGDAGELDDDNPAKAVVTETAKGLDAK